MPAPSDALIIFARYPEPGRVKTRLAESIGGVAAAELYAAFVTDLGARLAAPAWEVTWAIAPPDRGFARRFGLPHERCVPQVGADLGSRMHAALAAAADSGKTRCVLIGTDMPQIEPGVVREALARLEWSDLVLGPAEDGGYYLIAMRRAHDVFAGVEWSSPRVLEQTLARAQALGLRASLLAPGFDIDTLHDLDRLCALLDAPELATSLPATAAVLRALGRR